nr:MAG TPA: hypothetical protein [Caudoviricetes sp.]
MSEGLMRMVSSFVTGVAGRVLTWVYMCSKRGVSGLRWSGAGGGRRMAPYRRTRAVREASSSRTTTRRESGETVARQGKGVDGAVVQRGRSSGDAVGSVRS